jgi:HAD superfamily hydrolase (TIGR01509 family)
MNPGLAAVKAVLLDMDGTLVDSDAAVERSWRAWAREHRLDPNAVLVRAHGNPAATTVRTFAPHLSEAEVAAAAQRQLEQEYVDLDGVVATPGAHELLYVLARRGLPWAVVTSADQRLAKIRLTAAGIDAPLLITVEDVSRGKPDPEGYLMAAAELGVDPAHCLVVEDSAPGIAAGQDAGAQVAALRGLPADYTITDLGELARWLS